MFGTSVLVKGLLIEAIIESIIGVHGIMLTWNLKKNWKTFYRKNKMVLWLNVWKCVLWLNVWKWLECHYNSYFWTIIALYPVLGNEHYCLVRIECLARRNESGCVIKKLLSNFDSEKKKNMFLNSWDGSSRIVRVILDEKLLLGINQLVLVHYILEWYCWLVSNNYWRRYDGDTKSEILFIHANDHRRWRIAQTIERLDFNLCFGFNLYELLVEFY
jgi:hypothetical protein